MKSYSGPERRKYRRLIRRVPLLYRQSKDVSLDHLLDPRESATRNIARGGLNFEADVYIPADTTLEVRIRKRVGRWRRLTTWIQGTCRVVWIKRIAAGKYRLGSEFINLDERDRKEIDGISTEAQMCTK